MQCNRTLAFNAFFNQVLLEPAKLALIGSGCSVATEPTAELAQFYNISQVYGIIHPATLCMVHCNGSLLSTLYGEKQLQPSIQISCVSSSTTLSDRSKFQRYFQLLPSEDTISPSYYSVIKAFGWKKVSIIEQNENLFTVVS